MAEKLQLEVDRIIKVCWTFGLDVLYEYNLSHAGSGRTQQVKSKLMMMFEIGT